MDITRGDSNISISQILLTFLMLDNLRTTIEEAFVLCDAICRAEKEGVSTLLLGV
jgi:hypothetical protein